MKLAVHITEGTSGTWSAWCPALPGCRVCGRSEQEVRGQVGDTVTGYLASVTNFVMNRGESIVECEMRDMTVLSSD